MSMADWDIMHTYSVSNDSFSWALAYSGISALGATVLILSCLSASYCKFVSNGISSIVDL